MQNRPWLNRALGVAATVGAGLESATTALKRIREFDEEARENPVFAPAYNSTKRYLKDRAYNAFYGAPSRLLAPHFSYPTMAFSKRRRSFRRRAVVRRRSTRSSWRRTQRSTAKGSGIVKKFPGRLSYPVSKYGRDIPFVAPSRPMAKPLHYQTAIVRWIAAAVQPSGSVNIPASISPVGFTNSAIVMVHNIQKGDSVIERRGPIVTMKRLEIRGTLHCGLYAAHNTFRFTLVYDRQPLPGVQGFPDLSEIFDGALASAHGSSISGYPFGFSNQNYRNRFDVLFQETIQLSRGQYQTGSSPVTWDNDPKDNFAFNRDLYLRDLPIRYAEGELSGYQGVVLQGNLYMVFQALGDATGVVVPSDSHSGVRADLTTRLLFADLG